MNVGCGPAEERVLLTGLHAVADIYCECCKTTLGWKYVSKFSNFFLLSLRFELIARFSVDLPVGSVAWVFRGVGAKQPWNANLSPCWKYDTRCAFKMSGLIFLLFFFFAFIGTCLWEQPKVQRRKVYHWNGTHDKRQWLGIAEKRTDPQWTKNFYMSSGAALDFVQRLCFIHNVKRAFILEQNHTDILIYERNNLELFRKKSSSFSL